MYSNYFYRQTLTSNELIDYLQQKNVLVWGGNVRESEAFQGKASARCDIQQDDNNG